MHLPPQQQKPQDHSARVLSLLWLRLWDGPLCPHRYVHVGAWGTSLPTGVHILPLDPFSFIRRVFLLLFLFIVLIFVFLLCCCCFFFSSYCSFLFALCCCFCVLVCCLLMSFGAIPEPVARDSACIAQEFTFDSTKWIAPLSSSSV